MFGCQVNNCWHLKKIFIWLLMNFRFDRQRKKRRRKITQQSIHPQHKYQNWNLLALLTLRKTSDKILLASTSPKIESCKNFPHWKVSNAYKTERHSEILKCTGRSYILGQFFFFFKWLLIWTDNYFKPVSPSRDFCQSKNYSWYVSDRLGMVSSDP